MTAARTSTTHLYAGFRHAGALASVHAQRDSQRRVLALLPGARLLIVGSAFGEEANCILYGTSRWMTVVAIDLADLASQVRRQPGLSALGSRLSCGQCDLLDAHTVQGYGGFDVAQCGFVLHDVRPQEKQHAMRQLAFAVRPGGHVIVSDIFSPMDQRQVSHAARVYDVFLREAVTARYLGHLTSRDFDELVGDGGGPGLLRSREEAVQGSRDFFESMEETIARARCEGLLLQGVGRNPSNADLAVLLFRRVDLRRERWTEAEEVVHVV